MDKVYLWTPSTGANPMGHIALDIGFGQGPGRAAYVSFFTTSGTCYGNTAFSGNYADDKLNMGHDAASAKEITCLDSRRMYDEWKRVSSNGNQYNLYLKNCSTLVADMLVAGGAALSAEVRRILNRQLIFAPYSVWGIIEVININADRIRRCVNNGFTPEPDSAAVTPNVGQNY